MPASDNLNVSERKSTKRLHILSLCWIYLVYAGLIFFLGVGGFFSELIFMEFVALFIGA